MPADSKTHKLIRKALIKHVDTELMKTTGQVQINLAQAIESLRLIVLVADQVGYQRGYREGSGDSGEMVN